MPMSKKFDDGIILENFDVIVIFPIYGKFGAIRKRDSGRMVWKTYIFNVTFYLTKTDNGPRKSLSQFSPIALSKGTIFD